MRLLTIGTDRLLFDPLSKVSKRIEEQSSLFSSHTIIVFTKRGGGFSERVVGNLRVIPTNSVSKILYGWDAIRIARKVGKEADLVSAQDPFETGLAGLFAARALHKPLHVQIHTDVFSPHFGVSFPNWIRQRISLFVIPRASCLRVVSERIKQSIETRFGSRPITVLPVYEPFAGEDVPGAGAFGFTKFFLMASRLEREKDIDVAIRAFAGMSPRHKGAGLVIAGSGREKSRLEALARHLGVGEGVVFLGWRNDLPALLRSASGFISTSRYEGYGVSLLMAARAGCPIITTDVGLIGEEIPRGDVSMISVGNERQCGEAMEALLTHEEVALDRAARLRTHVHGHIMTFADYQGFLVESYAECGNQK